MSPRLRLASAPRWKRGALVFLAAAGLAGLGYQAPAGVELELGRGFWSALATSGFHDAEGSYRWTRARSEIELPDPGGQESARLEIWLSGFRPRGAEPPLLSVEAGDARLRARATRSVEPYVLRVRTEGLWSSTVPVSIRSETFTPGAGDDRALGVRVHRARLLVGAGAVPPVRQLLSAGVLALVAFIALTRLGAHRLAGAGALGLGGILASGYALWRLETALLVPPLAAAAAAASLVLGLAPRWRALAFEAARQSLVTGWWTLRRLPSRGALLAGALAGLGCLAAFAASPRVELDLGSGRVAPVAGRFGSADRDEASSERFRSSHAGAEIDLRDFGWGRPWTIAVQARVRVRARAISGSPRIAVARVGDARVEGRLGEAWTLVRGTVPAPRLAWRAGHVLEVAGGLDVASIVVERGRSLPSPRVLAYVLLGCWSLLAASLASGLPERVGAAVAALGGLLSAAALALDPALAIPFVPTAATGLLATAALALAARGLLTALAARQLAPELHPAALAVAVLGFGLWFLVSASPLYSGGHFRYHSSVAEEIWQGNFLLYYLPGPDNMLARQPQWGNLVVPHPCLYHTVASPFAALPQPWFDFGTKLFLALLLFGIALVSGLLATATGSPRAGLYAAAIVAVTPAGFQLLGLGHLMTIFGCSMAALALGFVVLHAGRLAERRFFLGATALVALCFLSYTGSLLFASACLVTAAAILVRRDRPFVRAMAAIVAAAWLVALAAYYANWLLPFVTETVPALLAPGVAGGSIDLGARLAALPGKLDYTFGTFLLPLAGLLGITRVESARRRALLLSWVSVLAAFSLLDLFFNFLLKHHYFALPAVAVGAALLADDLPKKNAWIRGILLVVFVSLCWMGFREAWAAARGGVG